jgi:hypothetical protein
MDTVCGHQPLWAIALMLFLSVFEASAQVRNEDSARRIQVMITAQMEDGSKNGAGEILANASNRLYIVTANHVLRNGPHPAKTVKVKLSWLPGEAYDAELLENFDQSLDVGVLLIRDAIKLSVPALPFDSLGDSAALGRGDKVYSMGYPRGELWFSRPVPDVVSRASVNKIEFDSPSIAPGYSGGGLFNENWQLVGMIQKDNPPTAEALPINVVLDRVREWGYPVQLKRAAAATAAVPIPGTTTPQPYQTTDSKPGSTAAAVGASGYKVLTKFKIGGIGGWDYVTFDSVNRRIYAAHGTAVEVLADTGKVVGKIDQLHGVHGIAVAPDLGRGFITNGQSNTVTEFDLSTLAKTAETAAGKNPDAICYEPKTRRVFAINHAGVDATSFDAMTMKIVATIPTGAGGEFCAVDGAGKVYVNLETSSEILEIDAARSMVTRKASLAPCQEPSGLSIDVKGRKLFPVCSNKMMAVVDIPTMKVIATPAIGLGTDGGGFDSGSGHAFSANGGDGTLTVVGLVNGKYDVIDNVPTTRGARTMAVDEKTQRVFMLAAEYGPAPESKDGQKKGRPQVLPDSFHVLVVGK